MLLCFLFLNLQFNPAFATTIFEDGFESGDFSAWNGTSVTTGDTIQVISSDSHSGSYCMESGIDNPDADAAYAYKYLGNSYTTIHVRLYAKIVSSSLSATSHMSFLELRDYSEGKTRMTLRWYGDGHLAITYRKDGTLSTAESTTTMSTGTWHCLEVKCVIDSSNGEYRVWLDGTEVSDLTQTGIDSTTGTTYTMLRAGTNDNAGSGSVTIYEDDIVVADTYIGPEEEAPTEYTFTFTAQCNCSANLNAWRELSKVYSETASCTSTSYAWREYLNIFSEITHPSSQTFKWKELFFTFSETAFPTANFTKQIEYAITFYEFIFTQIVNPNANLNYWREIYKTFIDTANPSANMTKQAELKVTLAEFIETIIGKAVLYPLLPTPPPEEINWGIIALAFSIIAFTVGITALTAKRD